MANSVDFRVKNGLLVASTATIQSSANATSTATGALQVVGGVGIGRDLYVGGTIYGNGIISTATNIAGGTNGAIVYQVSPGLSSFIGTGTTGSLLQMGATTATFVTTGSVYVGYANVASAVALVAITNDLTATAPNYLVAVSTSSGNQSLEVTAAWGPYVIPNTGVVTVNTVTNATSTGTGALIVRGGAGIGASIFVGGTATVLSTLASTTTLSANALYIAGGVGIAKSLVVTGEAIFQNNVTFSGTSTYVYSTNTVYTDNILNIHAPAGSTGSNHTWTVDDGKDIGFVFHNYKGADNDSFLGWANNTGYLEWYGSGSEQGFGTFTNGVYGIFKTGGIILTNTTASDSTSTGALTVAGGVGIGGNLYVGGNIYGTVSGNITTATNLAGGILGQIPYQSAAGTTQYIGTGTAGTILQMGANTATFVTTGTIYIANAVTATNIRGGILGQIPYQTAAGATQYIGTGTAGTILQMGANTATFVSSSSVYVGFANTSVSAAVAYSLANAGSLTIGNATTATNLAGGTNGAIHYQISSGVSSFIGTGTTGSLLQMGATTATFVSSSSVYVGFANQAVNATTSTSAAVAYSLASTSSLQVGYAAVASQINTVVQSTSATYFLSFVDSNNATATAESVYTTSSFVINPATGQVGIGSSFISTSSKLVVNGRIESMTDPAGEGGQVILRGKAYRWSIDNYFDAFRIIREDDVLESNGWSVLTITSGTNNIVVVGGTSGYSGEKFAVNGGVYINGTLTATNIYGTFNGTIGSASVNTATNLAGGTAGQFAYQTAPGATSFVSTGSIYVGRAVVADSASGSSSQVNTVAQTANANYVLTFVDSNNATATAESIYTTSTVYVNPSTGRLTAVSIVAAQNGTGQSLLIGDDLWIGDINQANTTQLSGAQDSTQAYLVFGSSNSTSLGRSGAGPLTYGGNFRVDGVTTVTNTTNASSTITGALQVIGGVGIGGNLYVGGTIFGLTSISGTVSTATNIAGGLLGQIHYQTAAGATGFIGTGTTGSLLQMGANTATFVTTGSIYVGYANQAANATTATSAAVAYSLANAGSLTIGSATTATNLAGGTNGAIHYQVSPGISSFIGTGTTGSVLQMGATTATFVTTGSIYVGYANTATTATSAAVAYSLVGSATIGSATTATNLAGGVLGQIPYQNSAGITQYIGTGTAGTILQMGANTATFVTTGTVYIANAVTATNIRGGSSGSIPYQTAAGATQFINIGSAGQVLQSNGSTASFVSVGTLSAGTATSVAGGLLGQILYQTAAGTTGFIGTGTLGTILQMGANTATFVTTASVYVGRAVIADNASTASQVTTVAQTANATYFLTFVDANNATAAVETVYTTSSFTINASSGGVQIGGVTTVTNTTNATSTVTGALQVVGGMGVGRDLWVGAGVYAATKSFLIDHPSKPGWKLVHGSLEGPENGVYVRGKVTGSNKIHLPDFWINLVDFNTITVNLTPIGKYQQLFVENVEGLEITIANAQSSDMNFFYTVWAERIDVDKLRVEVN